MLFFTQNLCESASDPIFRRYFVYYKKWPVSLAAMKLHMSLANVFGIIFKQKECVKALKNIDGASMIVKWNIVSKHFFCVYEVITVRYLKRVVIHCSFICSSMIISVI